MEQNRDFQPEQNENNPTEMPRHEQDSSSQATSFNENEMDESEEDDMELDEETDMDESEEA